MRARTVNGPSRLRLVAGGLVGLLVVTASTSLSWADDASPSPRAATLPYGPEPHQVLDLERPDPDLFPGPRPVLIYLHAGGWIAGDRTEVPDMVTAQVARGYALASIDYRLATVGPDGQPVASFPGAIWDVKRAIRYVKANATTWGIDPDRVIVVGASAGGHLAAFVGATRGLFEPPDMPLTRDARRDSSVRGVVDFVGPTDLTTFERTEHPWAAPLTAAFLGCARPSEGNPLTCPDDRLETASVAPWIDRTDPPIFLAYGAHDELVVPATQGDPLARLWLGAHHGNQASVTYQVLEDAGHTLPGDKLLAALREFVDRVTRPARPVADGETAEPVAAPTVILYGDSLASESQTYFHDALVGAGITDVHTRTFGGTALCDWLDVMRQDAGALHPNTVVIEFSGNALTPCMHDARGEQLSGDAYYAKYLEDAIEALAIFSPIHARVYFAGAPLNRHTAETHEADVGRLNALYAELGSSRFVQYIDADAAVLDHGAWTSVLPCLPDEPCTGGTDATGTRVNVVRAADGTHFCPAPTAAIRGVTGDCPVWSSGAFRFGTAMADPVIRHLRPRPSATIAAPRRRHDEHSDRRFTVDRPTQQGKRSGDHPREVVDGRHGHGRGRDGARGASRFVS
jgi:acetyl esterase/lipase